MATLTLFLYQGKVKKEKRTLSLPFYPSLLRREEKRKGRRRDLTFTLNSKKRDKRRGDLSSSFLDFFSQTEKPFLRSLRSTKPVEEGGTKEEGYSMFTKSSDRQGSNLHDLTPKVSAKPLGFYLS